MALFDYQGDHNILYSDHEMFRRFVGAGLDGAGCIDYGPLYAIS